MEITIIKETELATNKEWFHVKADGTYVNLFATLERAEEFVKEYIANDFKKSKLETIKTIVC